MSLIDEILANNDSPSGVKNDGGPVVPVEPIDPVHREENGGEVVNHATVTDGSDESNWEWWLWIAAAAGITYVLAPKKAGLYVPLVVAGGLGWHYLSKKKADAAAVQPVEMM